MAITKIHPVKRSIIQSIEYICDPSKTNGECLVSSFACSPETADLEFTQALRETGMRKNGNLAYHLIQSFKPGEVTPEKAHEIAIRLADRILEGKYSYVCATHMDKDHVHSHIVFCAADNVRHRKYNESRESYRKIRQYNDEICAEHGLSVIPSSGCKGKHYGEWKAYKKGNSWKDRIRKDIDQAIISAGSYEEFLALLDGKGYQIKGHELGSGTRQYISFCPAGKERFVRGSVRSLGPEYTKERIAERILEKEMHSEKSFKKGTSTHLIDTSARRFAENPYLKRWATLQNLKLMAGKYNDVGTLTDLADRLHEASDRFRESREELAQMDKAIKRLGEGIKYARNYQAYLPIHRQYRRSADPDAYFRKHERELILFDGAREYLRENRSSLNSMAPDILTREYEDLTSRRQELSAKCVQYDKDRKKLEKDLGEMASFLGLRESRDIIIPGIESEKQR